MINKNFKKRSPIENTNKIENSEKESRFKIRTQTFINYIDFPEYREWNALAE